MSEEKDRVDGTADETKAETKSSDHHTEDTYEKVCFMCRRPESKAGKLITLPGNINICPGSGSWYQSSSACSPGRY